MVCNCLWVIYTSPLERLQNVSVLVRPILVSIKDRWLSIRPDLADDLPGGSPGQLDTFCFPRWCSCRRQCAACLGLCYQMYHEIRENVEPSEVQSMIWRISAVQGWIKASQRDLEVTYHAEEKVGCRHESTSMNWQRHCTESSSLEGYESWIRSWLWEMWNRIEIFSLWYFK